MLILLLLLKFVYVSVQNDIYFATTAPEFFHGKTERLQMDQQKAERESMSPPASPHCNYVIVFDTFIGFYTILFFNLNVCY